MKLLNPGNYLKLGTFSLFVLCFVITCNVSRQLPAKIIRYNYFDNNYYNMQYVDSNTVNRLLYQSILKKIDFNTTAKCLMLRIYSNSSIYDEYGLFDYKTQNYYYYSLERKKFYSFKEYLSPENKTIIDSLKYFVGDPTKALNNINNKEKLLDGNNFELSLITVNAQNEIIVRSYYW